jgi:hypothetical protein
MLRKKQSNGETPNLLELIPERLVECNKTSDGLTHLVIPKFRGKRSGKFLTSKLKHPTWKIDLDDIGTFVWDQIDGITKVKTISEKMKSHFGDKVEPVYDRLNLFLFTMRREELIRFKNWQNK